MNSEVANTSIILLALTVIMWLILRPLVLWYFRINERTELLRDIRDSLRAERTSRPQWIGENPRPGDAAAGPIQQLPGESEDQFNSRMADALERQIRGG